MTHSVLLFWFFSTMRTWTVISIVASQHLVIKKVVTDATKEKKIPTTTKTIYSAFAINCLQYGCNVFLRNIENNISGHFGNRFRGWKCAFSRRGPFFIMVTAKLNIVICLWYLLLIYGRVDSIRHTKKKNKNYNQLL